MDTGTRSITSIAVNIIKDILKAEDIRASPLKGLKQLVEQGKISKRFLDIYQSVEKAEKDFKAKKLSRQETEKIRKEASILIKAMLEYLQRKKAIELDRAKIRVKYGNKFAELFVFEKEAYAINVNKLIEKEINKCQK